MHGIADGCIRVQSRSFTVLEYLRLLGSAGDRIALTLLAGMTVQQA
jgi:hypothetical protein